MLGLAFDLLTDRYVATAFDDRELPEWPPHPARVFSALVATWAMGEDDPMERRALEWLEAQPPPRVVACETASHRALPVFVPVNDEQTISEPAAAREAVADAEAALVSAPAGSEASKARRSLERALAKLQADTARAVAAQSEPSAEDRKRGRTALPEGRTRQPRHFPSVVPTDPGFALAWEAEPPPPLREALRALCRRVVRVGHSSSLVRARVVGHLDGLAFVPAEDGPHVLRVPRVGQLAALEAAHAVHGEVEPRVLPCAFVRYRYGEAAAPKQVVRTVFSEDWIVLKRVDGPRLSTLATEIVARALRGAVLRYSEQPPSSLLSGHEVAGEVAGGAHAAYVPLPFVASEHADGQILGVALVLPRFAPDAERLGALKALARWEQEARRESGDPAEEAPLLALTLGRAGVLRVRRVAFELSARSTLQVGTWVGPSRRWASATPVALDRNPGDLHDADPARRARAFAEAEEAVSLACERIGLARPDQVQVLRSAVLPGSEKPVRYPPFPREPGRTRRVLVHVRLAFSEPVGGPVILGAGRYFGLGLCRPLVRAGRGA